MSDAPDDSLPQLLVGGSQYFGLESFTASRSIEHCASHFQAIVSERWLGRDDPWAIVPFDAIQVLIGKDVFLTGYVDKYAPRVDGSTHRVTIVGRSKTQDLVDCKPDIASGQFKGYGLAQIARAICGLFGIDVVIDPSAAEAVDVPVSDATLTRGETAFTFLERLGKLAGVLLTDTPQGALLLTRTGTQRVGLSNPIQLAESGLDMSKRFSAYIVKGQSGVAGGAGGTPAQLPLEDGAAAPSLPSGGTGVVQNAQHAISIDAGVPRYRPHVSIAESQLTQAQMQQRADWQRSYAYGRSIKAILEVPQYRDGNKALFAINTIAGCSLPVIGINQDLLVTSVALELSEQRGRFAKLTMSPPEGYTPDPASVKVAKHKGKKGKKGKSVLDIEGAPAAGQ